LATSARHRLFAGRIAIGLCHDSASWANVPYDPQGADPGVGPRDVWVFDAEISRTLTGTPLNIVSLFTIRRARLRSRQTLFRHRRDSTPGIKRTNVGEIYLYRSPATIPGRYHYAGAPMTAIRRSPVHGLIVNTTAVTGSYLRDVWDSYVISIYPTGRLHPRRFANPPVGARWADRCFRARWHDGSTIWRSIPSRAKSTSSNTDANNLERFAGPGKFTGNTVTGR